MVLTLQYFDIIFTPKKGYIFLRIEADFLEAPEIENPDELFDVITSEITSDVRNLFLCGEHMTVNLYPTEMEECRRRILLYIARLPEELREHYTSLMEVNFLYCNKE